MGRSTAEDGRIRRDDVVVLERRYGRIQEEIAQRRPFHSIKAEVAVSILRTAALIERHFAQVVAQHAASPCSSTTCCASCAAPAPKDCRRSSFATA